MADKIIKVAPTTKLRPPNVALKGKKRKEQPTVDTDHTKKAEKLKDKNVTPLIKGFQSSSKKIEDLDFFDTVYNSSVEFHKQFKPVDFKKYTCGSGSSKCIIEEDKNKNKRTIVLDPKEWAFGEADLLTSLNTEENGFTIKENCIPYVNGKAECIRSLDLVKYYKTHIGAFVLVNHKQDLSKVKGVILDVVLREIVLEDKSKIYYSRGLIAVNRKKDSKLAKALEQGKIKFGSMGSFYSSVTCGYCGMVGLQGSTNDTRCIHLKMMKGQNYTKPNGGLGCIVEWWNAHDEENKKTPIEFIEYSLLVCKDDSVGGSCRGVNPAWSGSVVSSKSVEGLKTTKPVKIEVEELYLRKPAFQMFLRNGDIKIMKKGKK
jgi:hypothetical protein